MNLAATRLIALLAALLWAAFAAMPATATSVVPMNLTQITGDAEQVVHVRCVSNVAQRDAAVGVVTVTTFVVFDRPKGAGGGTLTLRQAGGTLDGLSVHYPVPQFQVGEEYVLFVPAASKLGLASPVGLGQGVFTVAPGPSGKSVGNGRDFSELLVGINSALVPPGIAGRLAVTPAQRTRMDLSDFLDLVRSGAASR